MDLVIVIPALGLILTFSTSIVIIAFRIGHISARIEELEKWRISIRVDMHEISDQIQKVNNTLSELSTLIKERTERRNFRREIPIRENNE